MKMPLTYAEMLLTIAKGDKGDPGPQGPTGATGPQGPVGPKGDNGADGKSAYEIWLDKGHTGTEEDFLDAIKGPTGPQGPKGDTGAAMTFDELTVEQKAELKGETGPQGPIGPTGPQGPKGNDGNVAFDSLTPEQIEQIRGPQGIQGPIGPKGDKGDTGATPPVVPLVSGNNIRIVDSDGSIVISTIPIEAGTGISVEVINGTLRISLA